MSNIVRINAVHTIGNGDVYLTPVEKTSIAKGQVFGELCFGKKEMKKGLSKEIYAQLLKIIDDGANLDNKIADKVASAMKDWAISKGATHFTHIFYPLTGFSAEKHDTFIKPDGQNSAVSKLSGQMLLKGEPDASSFPNGGIRETHEARGYTIWDPVSPAYIIETDTSATLYIPTVFVSWTGDSLDMKLPLYRAEKALSKQARRILTFLKKKNIDSIISNTGAEQEYFLIDRNFYLARPDLIVTGRTLFGANSSKGQEFDDHYFGVVAERIINYMAHVDMELFKLGIPSTTRHNEVAPGQFEIAPLFERSVIACDQQQVIMSTLKKIALIHGFVCLLHEKPFAGINGNGKHLNWSLSNKNQGNLFDPGAMPHKNLQFLLFCAAVIRAVHKFGGLLRMTIASAGNDHRLGANEAPPAILSVFLGEQLYDIFENIRKGKTIFSGKVKNIDLNINSLPTISKDPGDRNRTSPFAFTGNRFEFRAVGGNQNVAKPLLALNLAMTEALDFVATELESSKKKGEKAVISVIQKVMKEHGQVIFNGNGYSSEWCKEAKVRGLVHLKTAAEALEYVDGNKEIENVFGKYNILTQKELLSRIEVDAEMYRNTIVVEAKETLNIARTIIVPSVLRYEKELAENISALKLVRIKVDKNLLSKVVNIHQNLSKAMDKLELLMNDFKSKTMIQNVNFYCFKVIPVMNFVRQFSDELEKLVADDLWVLPKYQEMLFMK